LKTSPKNDAKDGKTVIQLSKKPVQSDPDSNSVDSPKYTLTSKALSTAEGG
jgi:hypothetical protein